VSPCLCAWILSHFRPSFYSRPLSPVQLISFSRKPVIHAPSLIPYECQSYSCKIFTPSPLLSISSPSSPFFFLLLCFLILFFVFVSPFLCYSSPFSLSLSRLPFYRRLKENDIYPNTMSRHKLAFLGARGVGKTALVQRQRGEKFNSQVREADFLPFLQNTNQDLRSTTRPSKIATGRSSTSMTKHIILIS
jgi:hypothetical protein